MARVHVLVLLLLAGCATAPETRRVVPGDPASAGARIAAELTRLGFADVMRSDGAVSGRTGSVEQGWAICGPILVGDGDDRYRMVSVGRERAAVQVLLAPAPEGVAITVEPTFVGEYRHPGKGILLERPCRTGGTLERLILAAAAG